MTREVEATNLAHVTYLHSPSLSRILKDLEKRKFIVKRTNKADMRRTIVSISSRGSKLIEAVSPHSEAVYAEIARRIGVRKFRLLEELLRELEERMLKTAPISTDVNRHVDIHLSKRRQRRRSRL